MSAKRPLWAGLGVLLSACWLAEGAEVPGVMHYQGRVLVSTQVFEGAAQFKFAYVSADGAQCFWGNSPDANHDGEPDSAVSISVNRGLYSVLLGDTNLANMASLPADVFTNSAVYLRVWFNDGAHGFQLLAPDHRVSAAGYAMLATTVPDGAITVAKLAPGTLSAANLSGTLQPGQIPDLDASKITSGTLQPSRIPDLDAGKITSGTLDVVRLPASVAYQDDILSLSNTLAASLEATNAALVAQLNALGAQAQALADRLTALSNHLEASLPPGMAAASVEVSDAALAALGYESFATLPAPAWVTGAKAGAPSARYDHGAVWSGQQMLVWGGALASGFLSGTGAAYDPSQDTWATISPIDAPSARGGHTAVWTGQEMLVWGGYGASGYLDTGGRFDPASKVWNPLPTNGAPSGRAGHVAAWTGSRLVVWGGRSGAGLLSDGAWLHLASNQWTALNLPGAPSARFGATAVWTGDRLIVWGGEGAEGVLKSGAQLLFDTNGAPSEWRALSLPSLSARTGHSAVWTGTKMIVWGGRNGSPSYFADGGAYDPGDDSWTVLPVFADLAARSGHCAVWTSQEMLVFGGAGAGGAMASGAAYHPTSARWRLLSVAGNPQPRSQGAAVWTGSELLVFGGRMAGQPVGALQRLTPTPTWYLYRKP